MVNKDLISALRVDIYDCHLERPATIISREKPKNFVQYAWIPQTICDQIWVLYQFETVEERLSWESSLSPLLKKWLDRKLIDYALSYGWQSRDENGWPAK